MKTFRLLSVLPVLVLAACGTDSGAQKSTAAAPPAQQGARERSVESWVSESGKDNGFVKDASGNLVPKSSKRSSFEGKGQDPNFAGKDYKTKQYKAGDYARKSWWGNKEYTPKSYTGNTDGSRFRKSSALQGKGAREAGNAADLPDDYKTGAYATNSAREAGASPVKKSSNDLIENRRNSYEQPEVIDWREQRALTMDQAKGILGH